MSRFSGLALDVDKPGRLMLVNPVTRQPLRDGAGNEAWIDLYSSDSAAARTCMRAQSRRRLNVRGRVRLTPEELEADSVELLAALTVDWRLLSLDGEHLDVPCTPENARELYAEAAVAWIREQVDEFVGDRSNFSKASSAS